MEVGFSWRTPQLLVVALRNTAHTFPPSPYVAHLGSKAGWPILLSRRMCDDDAPGFVRDAS